MQFLRRVLGGHRASPATPPLALYDSAAAPDSRRADTLLAALTTVRWAAGCTA